MMHIAFEVANMMSTAELAQLHLKIIAGITFADNTGGFTQGSRNTSYYSDLEVMLSQLLDDRDYFHETGAHVNR